MNYGDRELVNIEVILTPNKLANVRRDIMKKNRLTAEEIEEIKTKIRQPINTEGQNPEHARLRLKNLPPEQTGKTIKPVRQGNEINDTNKPVQLEELFEENETFIVEKKEVIGEIKLEILGELFKTQNMNIEEQEPLLKQETSKKNKLNIRIDNIALDQVIKSQNTFNNIECINILDSKGNYGKMWYEKEKQK